MYHQDDINNMNYKQLRETVSELNDKYVKLKRTLEDALDNIDESNLATTLRKKLNGYDTQFSVTAEKIESKVSYEDLENSLNQYSTVSQTAQAIEMSVVSSQEYTDNSVETLSSTFTMTADGISTRVSKLKKGVETQFNQTAEKIESLAFEKMNTSEAVTVKEKPSASDKTLDKEKLCKYNNKYYYFNDILQDWLEYDEKNGINSAFTQISGGFILNGCVKVSGDLITEGTITGTDIVGAKFYNEDKRAYVTIGNSSGNYGDLTLKRVSNGEGQEVFQIYDTGVGIAIKAVGTSFIGSTGSKTYPKGTWDFSKCTVIGLPTSTS